MRKKCSTKYRQLTDSDTGEKLDIWTLGGHETPAPHGMPDKIVIRGRHYKIRYYSHIYNRRKRSGRLWGCCMHYKRVIFLEHEAPIAQMRETLYHEAAHVYLNLACESSKCLTKLNHEQIESVCDLLGEAVYDLAMNNPSLK